MPEVNEYGQLVGDVVPEWSPRPRPDAVTLEGRYVVVEPLAVSHAVALLASTCGPDDRPLWTYRATEPPAGLEEMTDLIARTLATPDLLTFALCPEGRAAEGIASYTRLDPATGQVEVAGVLFARTMQRTRAATEAIHLLMRYAFDDLGFRRFEWKCDSLNEPSRRAAERLGFRYEGRFRHHMVTKGRNRDTDWYSVTDAEWPAVRAAHEAWLDPANFDEEGRQRTSLSAALGAGVRGVQPGYCVRMSDDAHTTLSENDIEQAGLEDWRVLFTALHARYRTEDFGTALDLVKKIGKAAEKADHHPDIDLSYGRVGVRLSSHDAGGVTERDVDLARQITGLASDVGAEPAPGELSVIEIALDTPTYDDVKPFWAAVLGYETSKSHAEELNDPDGTRPTLWFQKADQATGEVQQRFHLDVRVPPEAAEERVRKALEAGGTLVSDERAPTVWVLADAHGNHACVTTWLGRDPDHGSSEGDAAGKIDVADE